ncbi:Phthalate dioxygenase reductase [Paraburkholderia caffeinitolerans]|uniref:Phthalate dioxygenase reductase n=1 Tax=Paraburkholderia caffeinitolerans TaxID=1723730 RepID=A0A6J5FQR1_9BURK|nr:PDR/VanB family oxidoreductase [Paraburkholderia caffeinitolerans]CAB3783419.1 Phthalate dioxygenase reductase [Paraburkholderia caffeinitolerans]
MNALIETIEVVVGEAEGGTDDTRVLKLARPDGEPLPAYRPGAHVDVYLPNGLVRQYSLCGPNAQAPDYRIAVKRASESRGGSEWLCGQAGNGTPLRIGMPRHAFSVNEAARHHILVAGGIGVTPILSMAYALQASGESYQFEYFVRSDADTVFRDEIMASPLAGQTRIHPALAPQAVRERIAELLAAAKAQSHLYVCGPEALMQTTAELARGVLGDANVHMEAFAPSALPATGERGFAVMLDTSGKTVEVPPGKSVLACLREAGHEIESSCEVGVCGTCMMRVIKGEPDHRDSYLTDDERVAGAHFIPCVSRSKSPVLVLACEP